MTAKGLRKLQDKHNRIMLSFNAYASLARGWDIEDEDDISDLVDAVMDILLEEGEKHALQLK